MTPDPKPGTILGSHGETVFKPPDSVADLNLPAGVQALIETRINAAVEDLKEDNRKEVKQLIEKHTRKWQITAALSAAFAIGSWFVAPQQIRKWAKDYVQQRMTAPELKKAADAAITSQMGDYVKGQLESLKRDIDTKQKQLADDQATLREQVEVQELVTAAKTGDMTAYQKILTKSQMSGRSQASATAALHEVEIYYDFDAAQIFYSAWGDAISHQDPGWSIDELLGILHKNDAEPTDRIAIINTIGTAARSQPNAVHALPELYGRLESEKDLRVRARLVWAINIISKQQFRPLDFAGCRAWWKLHKDEPAYAAVYDEFFRVYESPSPKMEDVLVVSDSVIRRDPRALLARTVKATALLNTNRVDDAEKEIADAEKIAGDYRWILLLKARLKLRQEKRQEAIEALNAAMQKAPGMEADIRSDKAFASIIADPSVKFPSQSEAR
jgi:tetratricopeptide (TPR) repeat protein